LTLHVLPQPFLNPPAQPEQGDALAGIVRVDHAAQLHLLEARPGLGAEQGPEGIPALELRVAEELALEDQLGFLRRGERRRFSRLNI
jgi:hypothetical protein